MGGNLLRGTINGALKYQGSLIHYYRLIEELSKEMVL